MPFLKLQKKVFAFIFFLFCSLFSFAQQTFTVSGTIHSSTDDAALTGASVRVKGEKVGTSTDASGKFTIKASKGAVLTITNVGYTNQEIVINSQTDLNINWSPLLTPLNR